LAAATWTRCAPPPSSRTGGGTTGIAGDYRGVDSIPDLFGRIFQKTAGTFRSVPYRVLADDYVVAFTTAAGAGDGRSLEDWEAHVVRLHQGKIAESQPYLGNQPTIGAWA
jgi:ketosteroid isomerase-like protein